MTPKKGPTGTRQPGKHLSGAGVVPLCTCSQVEGHGSLAISAINIAPGNGAPYKRRNGDNAGEGEKPVDQHGLCLRGALGRLGQRFDGVRKLLRHVNSRHVVRFAQQALDGLDMNVSAFCHLVVVKPLQGFD